MNFNLRSDLFNVAITSSEISRATEDMHSDVYLHGASHTMWLVLSVLRVRIRYLIVISTPMLRDKSPPRWDAAGKPAHWFG